MNIDAVRRLLALADPARDPYTVAEVAIGLLAANPGDTAARACYARALGELKLFAAAQKLLGVTSPAGNPSGLLPWTSRARRFAANLRALDIKDPQGAALVQAAAKELSRSELHQSADGNFQILDTSSALATHWLGALADHKAAQSLWQYDRAKTPIPPPILFEGLGHGWLFLHILATTENTFVNYSCAVHILEGDPLALAMLLHMHDLQDALAHPRTHWFIRSDSATALRDFRQAITSDCTLSVPEQFVRCPLRPLPAIPVDDTLKTLGAERRKNRDLLTAQAAAHYAGKNTTFWAARFKEASAGGAPLRVLGITSRFTTVLQHSMAEMKSAVESGGSTMVIAIEPDVHSLENPCLEMIASFKPDLIIQISRMRYENPAIPRSVPFLCWDQDNLPCMRTPEATASLDALTYVAGHGAVYGYSLLNWPRRNLIFCHPAGATFQYANAAALTAAELAPYECDISFISNASQRPEQIRDQEAQRWRSDARLSDIFKAAAATILQGMDAARVWEFSAVQTLVRQCAANNGPTLAEPTSNELAMSLVKIADRCFRHAALHWVGRWCRRENKSFRLYGSGWQAHPGFAEFAAGPAKPGREVMAIYRASRINLQLIEGGFVHSRALDGLAAGGFFLTRPTPNDGRGDEIVHAMAAISRQALDQNLRSRRQLENCTDPNVQGNLAILRPFLTHFALDEEIRGLEVWAVVPHAPVIFPQLAAISFRNETEFAQLAAKFLDAPDLRSQIAADMRAIMLEIMSYSRRWKQFAAAIAEGLSAGTPLTSSTASDMSPEPEPSAEPSRVSHTLQTAAARTPAAATF